MKTLCNYPITVASNITFITFASIVDFSSKIAKINKIILKLVLIILPVIVPVIITGDLIVVDTEVHYKEINVKRGVDFTLRLKGSGWYLNRYDTGRLGFKFRVVEPGYTDFTIRTSDDGQAYLFFSYLNKDMYVLVNIKGSLPENNSTELQENAEDTVFKKEIKTEAFSERGKKLVAEKAVPGDAEIYYVGKDKKVIKVPDQNEDAEYKKGVQLFNDGLLEKALMSFMDYLSNCESCLFENDALFKIGDIYYQLNNHEKALTAYLQVIDKGLDVDEVYFRVAFIYDSPGGLRDLEKAFRFYMIITENFISSEHYQYAKQRVKFFEKNFFRYE